MLSLSRQRRLFDKVVTESNGKVVIDMDVTAEKRPGYFGMMSAGPLFVENRYSDYATYWPHLTLRALWALSEVVDPLRLRMAVLNPLRNREKYGDDPLAPAAYPAETLVSSLRRVRTASRATGCSSASCRQRSILSLIFGDICRRRQR